MLAIPRKTDPYAMTFDLCELAFRKKNKKIGTKYWQNLRMNGVA